MVIEEIKRDTSRDYLNVFRAINVIPFPVGRNLLADFLLGDTENASIQRNKMQFLNNFGILEEYSKDEVLRMIDMLIRNKMLDLKGSLTNKLWKTLRITYEGRLELLEPKLDKKEEYSFNSRTDITSEDKEIFKEFGSFLQDYNDEQKKAIISNKDKILCLAGAGSGKTRVLVKRIEFLTKYQSINPDKILAITFTRKARQEMQDRLTVLGINAKIETFNSFCEKILKENEQAIYGREMRVINYSEKQAALNEALESLNLKPFQAISLYFSESQRNNKTPEQLFNIFMNDCFFVIDYFKSKNKKIYDFAMKAPDNFDCARLLYNVCNYLSEFLDKNNLRDYTDQILDTIKFFKSNSVPEFEHILVDEYQDVNAMQIELLDLLNAKNLFCVGDPRQSIYGWRGSDINYILKFNEKYPDAEIINLIKNYRSRKHIVDFMNASIKHLNLPDVQNVIEGEKNIYLRNFENEEQEYSFVINEILGSRYPRHEIFVLARTNRQLNELSLKLRAQGIAHIVKSEEIHSSVIAREGEVTLATVHAIKGLEAKEVLVIGCNDLNFPCKASDHPVIELIKIDDYDKEEEERRLFYVAVSRAKEKLSLSYTGKKPTYFINEDMKKILD